MQHCTEIQLLRYKTSLKSTSLLFAEPFLKHFLCNHGFVKYDWVQAVVKPINLGKPLRGKYFEKNLSGSTVYQEYCSIF